MIQITSDSSKNSQLPVPVIVVQKSKGILGMLSPFRRLDLFFKSDKRELSTLMDRPYPGYPGVSAYGNRAMWSRELEPILGNTLRTMTDLQSRITVCVLLMFGFSLGTMGCIHDLNYGYAAMMATMLGGAAWVFTHSIGMNIIHAKLSSLHGQAETYRWHSLMSMSLKSASRAGLKMAPELETLRLLTARDDIALRAEQVSLGDVAALADLAYAIRSRSTQIVHDGDSIHISGTTSELLSRTIEVVTGDEQNRNITL